MQNTEPEFSLLLHENRLDAVYEGGRSAIDMGSFAFDDIDFATHMAVLRDTICALSVARPRMRAVLPQTAVLSLVVPLGGHQGAVSQNDYIFQSLVGRTPYAVEDLLSDFTVRHGQAYVAVVARETLVEAEAFLHKYHLTPSYFTAHAPEFANWSPRFVMKSGGKSAGWSLGYAALALVLGLGYAGDVYSAPPPRPDSVTSAQSPEIVELQDHDTQSGKPRLSSRKRVEKLVTIKGGLRYGNVNLIGVYGKAPAQRALVRLKLGGYKRVKVGDRLDGGVVRAISGDRLIYDKGGKAIELRM